MLFVYEIGSVQVPKECIHSNKKLNTAIERTFIFQDQPMELKCSALGINSHYYHSIQSQSLDHFWFGDYLKSTTMDGDIVQVDAYFRVLRRTETADPQFIHSKLNEYQSTSGGLTHLVEEVVYGAEFICSMRKKVDMSCETKENAEGRLYLAAKSYFDQAIGPNSTSTQPSPDLENVDCIIHTSLQKGVLQGSFRSSCEYLRDVINKDNPLQSWRPIEILLRFIPTLLNVRLAFEKTRDKKLEFERTELKWNRIKSQSISLLSHPIVDRVPPIKKMLMQFRSLLEPLFKVLNEYPPEDFALSVSNLMEELIEWLIHRRHEVEKVAFLLENTELQAMNLDEIKTLAASKDHKRAKVFIFRIKYIEDKLMKSIAMLTMHGESAGELPVFPLLSAGKERLECIVKKIQKFVKDAKQSPAQDTDYGIALVPISSSFDDGTIQTINYIEKAKQGEWYNLFFFFHYFHYQIVKFSLFRSLLQGKITWSMVKSQLLTGLLDLKNVVNKG